MKTTRIIVYTLILVFLIRSNGAAQDAQRNFATRVELQPTAPVVNGTQQITATGSAGGGGGDPINCQRVEFPEVHHYDQSISLYDGENYDPNETIQVTIIAPDGKIYREGTQRTEGTQTCGWLNVSFNPTLSDLGGTWKIELQNEAGKKVVHSTRLEPYKEPNIRPFCEGTNFTFVFEGFAPQELLYIELVEHNGSYPDAFNVEVALSVDSVMGWAVNVDDQGQLLVTFSKDVTFSNLRYFVIYDSYGQSWGAQVDYRSNEDWYTADGCMSILSDEIDSVPTVHIQPPYIYGSAAGSNREEYIAFEGQAGQSLDIRMELLGDPAEARNPDLILDSVVQLIAPNGDVIAENDDGQDVKFELDAHIENVTLPQNGTYLLVPKSNGKTFGSYKLSILTSDDILSSQSLPQGVTSPLAIRVGVNAMRLIDKAGLDSFPSVWEIGQPFRDSTKPTVEEYTASIYYINSVRVTFTWCADSSPRLKEILAPLSLELSIDDFTLPQNVWLQTDTDACRYWDTILTGFVPEVDTILELRYTLSEDIFDGYATYKAGEYVHRITITPTWE